MRVSVCITTFNEEKSIEKLLKSLLSQTKLPDEIVIADGGSYDSTISRISKYANIQNKNNTRIKIISSKKRISISKGRNIAVKNSRYPIIAMTDGGCLANEYWLERIIGPFNNKKVDVVAGFYTMTGKTKFQEALKPYLGIMPSQFDIEKYLPSARSIAFRKSVWKRVRGFNEKLDRAGEDTDFDLKILKQNFSIVRTKKAIVKWEVPDDLLASCKKFFYYAKGDAQMKSLTSHNIHVITIMLRYLIFGYLIFFGNIYFKFLGIFFLIIYLAWAFYKSFKYKNKWKVGLWGTIIQIASDFSVMLGFLAGIQSWVIQNK